MNIKNEDSKDQFYSESNMKTIKESVKKSFKELEQMADK